MGTDDDEGSVFLVRIDWAFGRNCNNSIGITFTDCLLGIVYRFYSNDSRSYHELLFHDGIALIHDVVSPTSVD